MSAGYNLFSQYKGSHSLGERYRDFITVKQRNGFIELTEDAQVGLKRLSKCQVEG